MEVEGKNPDSKDTKWGARSCKAIYSIIISQFFLFSSFNVVTHSSTCSRTLASNFNVDWLGSDFYMPKVEAIWPDLISQVDVIGIL
jgi:hypothetical protein